MIVVSLTYKNSIFISVDVILIHMDGLFIIHGSKYLSGDFALLFYFVYSWFFMD